VQVDGYINCLKTQGLNPGRIVAPVAASLRRSCLLALDRRRRVEQSVQLPVMSAIRKESTWTRSRQAGEMARSGRLRKSGLEPGRGSMGPRPTPCRLSLRISPPARFLHCIRRYFRAAYGFTKPVRLLVIVNDPSADTVSFSQWPGLPGWFAMYGSGTLYSVPPWG